MIGNAKSEAVRELATAHRIDPDSSTAYGDHVSDVQDLRRPATHHGWDRLPKAPTPPTVPCPNRTPPRQE